MSQMEFEGLIAPTGVCADTATDTREFEVTIDSDNNWSDIRAAIGEQLVADGIVSQWAFRKHWEIASFTSVNADRIQRLRETLLTSSTTAPADAESTTMPIHMFDKRTEEWVTTTIVIEPEVQTEFDDWTSTLDAMTNAAGLRNGMLHEAICRGVSATKPSLPREMILEPFAAQTRFINLALLNKQTVLNKLDELTITY